MYEKCKPKMCNKFKDVDIKNRRYSFFDDIINLYPKNIKTDEKSYNNILIYCNGYVAIKGLKYVKFNSENPLYLIFSKLSGYF